jgi:molybdopterin converting factor small subunit
VAITIRIPPLWRSSVGGVKQVELPAGNLPDVLDALIERFPPLGTHLFDERGEIRASLHLFVNQENVRFRGGLSAHLRDGDEVYIVPMITGGGW